MSGVYHSIFYARNQNDNEKVREVQQPQTVAYQQHREKVWYVQKNNNRGNCNVQTYNTILELTEEQGIKQNNKRNITQYHKHHFSVTTTREGEDFKSINSAFWKLADKGAVKMPPFPKVAW